MKRLKQADLLCRIATLNARLTNLKARDAKIRELLEIYKISILDLVCEPWRNAFINWFTKKWEQGLLPKCAFNIAFGRYRDLFIIQEVLSLLEAKA